MRGTDLNEILEQEVSLLHDRICQALGDPKRILLLYELKRGSRRVNELSDAMSLPQPTVSRHLKILRERALVDAHREGTGVIYSLSMPEIITAIDYMRSVLRLILEKESSKGNYVSYGNPD